MFFLFFRCEFCVDNLNLTTYRRPCHLTFMPCQGMPQNAITSDLSKPIHCIKLLKMGTGKWWTSWWPLALIPSRKTALASSLTVEIFFKAGDWCLLILCKTFALDIKKTWENEFSLHQDGLKFILRVFLLLFSFRFRRLLCRHPAIFSLGKLALNPCKADFEPRDPEQKHLL